MSLHNNLIIPSSSSSCCNKDASNGSTRLSIRALANVMMFRQPARGKNTVRLLTETNNGSLVKLSFLVGFLLGFFTPFLITRTATRFISTSAQDDTKQNNETLLLSLIAIGWWLGTAFVALAALCCIRKYGRKRRSKRDTDNAASSLEEEERLQEMRLAIGYMIGRSISEVGHLLFKKDGLFSVELGWLCCLWVLMCGFGVMESRQRRKRNNHEDCFVNDDDEE